MRVLLAVLFAAAILAIGIGMLRALGGGRSPHGAPDAPAVPMPADVRVTFWCENCGTEVLLLRRGSETPPRHCGESMVRREEIARSP